MGRENKRKIIFNATPLIYLGKTSVLKKIIDVFNEVYITEAVYDEVVRKGKQIGAEEEHIIEDYIKRGIIKVIKDPSTTISFSETYQLGKGESSTILATVEKNYVAIIDDERARKIGEKFNIEIRGTLFLLKLLFLFKKLSRAEVEDVIRDMVNKGFRLSTAVILMFLNDIKLEEKMQ